ncbi:hypothetical protein FHR56_001820 [Xanthomonas sacchari]|uniref:hypothetical protein n=1 Tax=unclassified Xanthomonas TaxID=2643310 RepID=UPI0013680544|nr:MULTISPECIES: hypothetical protein [unclassified Xanthomonas]MBB6366707.1 hypothetical protein [Xanthomonas sp. F10]MXV34088.1 hypothetical protein [Xanthomonas sp. LMG 8989]
MMRRSSHTNYKLLETQIYEYKGSYFVLEMCQQGQVLLPQHGSEQLASEFCALSAKLDRDVGAEELGQATLKALNDFDTQAHSFDEYDIAGRNKVVSGWFGARGMGILEKNCRVVQVLRYLERGEIRVVPFDNHNRINWNGPMEEKAVSLSGNAGAFEVGRTVQSAFLSATYHPKREDPVS